MNVNQLRIVLELPGPMGHGQFLPKGLSFPYAVFSPVISGRVVQSKVSKLCATNRTCFGNPPLKALCDQTVWRAKGAWWPTLHGFGGGTGLLVLSLHMALHCSGACFQMAHVQHVVFAESIKGNYEQRWRQDEKRQQVLVGFAHAIRPACLKAQCPEIRPPTMEGLRELCEMHKAPRLQGGDFNFDPQATLP